MKSENKKRICVSLSPCVIEEMDKVIPLVPSRLQPRMRKSEFVEKAIENEVKRILEQ